MRRRRDPRSEPPGEPAAGAANGLLRGAARRVPGLRRIRRRATADHPAFDLTYVRTGELGSGAGEANAGALPPIVVIPGGPGIAATLPYLGLRGRAAAKGIELIMVEHRGVGLSRRDLRGRDLPPAAMRVEAAVDDIAAVLDAEGVTRAFVYGASYGSYLAAGLGVRRPGLVAGMVLDSPMVSATDHEVERELMRSLFWTGDDPATAALTDQVHRLAAAGVEATELLVVVRAAYELGGPHLLGRLLTARLAGRGAAAWAILRRYADREGVASHPRACLYEFDLVGTLAFRELHYAPTPDGRPFDTALTYAAPAQRYAGFVGEPFDLPRDFGAFDWPTVVLSGRRDLRTPPSQARLAASLLPSATLVDLDNGHSALESHPLAALHVMERLRAGRHRALLDDAALLSDLSRQPLSARLPDLVHLALLPW
ncbi:pimeloyl-ACP methyl ester carboxylesterase [Kineosphaera limosa]|uniref:Putative hydrolase n=1 Tax=Kineosphaera limosa NBRC 100340 TaxID=1184609 RepID=K6XBL8_9MICO|nr:alpha/beta fold hydrolase [Kineosphaera limosa]NYE03258.1 pimeloyl-ACP methyl ester carboxylesterase [Kineosphaera limosa]GAB96219.1 putative hydrolase [Kineosphaera limosa NBRC 100340]